MAMLRRMAESADGKRERSLWRPILRVVAGNTTDAGTVVVALATRGREPGSALVTLKAGGDLRPLTDDWIGRIHASGHWSPSYRAAAGLVEDVEAALSALERDPDAALVAYGRIFGACGICGRLLTNRESIERGIGPICAGRVGL